MFLSLLHKLSETVRDSQRSRKWNKTKNEKRKIWYKNKFEISSRNLLTAVRNTVSLYSVGIIDLVITSYFQQGAMRISCDTLPFEFSQNDNGYWIQNEMNKKCYCFSFLNFPNQLLLSTIVENVSNFLPQYTWKR